MQIKTKLKGLNIRGASHHFLLPVLAILVVAGIGGFIMQRSSSAATKTKPCAGITFGRYKNNPANGGKYTKYKPCVKAIQAKVGSKQDGIYGDYTQKRVKIWQSNHGKYADGVVGPKTWAAMGIKPTYATTTATTTKEEKRVYGQDVSWCRYLNGPTGMRMNCWTTRNVVKDSKAHKAMTARNKEAWGKCRAEHVQEKSICERGKRVMPASWRDPFKK